MFPIKDNIPSVRPPYVTYVLIAANSAAFLLEYLGKAYLPQILQTLAFVPGRFLQAFGHDPQFLALALASLVTSIFLHAGWLHLIGNMWFLHIFGDNVEDTLGHGRYLLFYLLSGAGANLIYLAFSPSSLVPLIGASGAIAGVMGAYINLFPGARVRTLVPIFFFITFVDLPAYIFLGFWFFLQFLFGTFSLGAKSAGGGVAWWAHVGGFLVGILLLHLFAPKMVRPLWRRRGGEKF